MRRLPLLGLLLMTSPGLSLDASETEQALLVTDLRLNSPDLGWFVVNDNVMGGQSEGDFRHSQDGLVFAGRTNTNGGGFSSIRTQPVELDLSSHAGIRLRLKGDGRRYTWRLTTDARWMGREVAYWAEFETSKDRWTTVEIRWKTRPLFGPPAAGLMR